MDDVEYATLQSVEGFNNRRLLELTGNNPPTDYDALWFASANAA